MWVSSITNIFDDVIKYRTMYVVEILPGLWLGDEQSALDIDFLESKNIEMVINCSLEAGFANTPQIKKKIRLNIQDNLKPEEINKMYINLTRVVEAMKENIRNCNILVHCKAGIQRSATIICAFLMKYANMSMEDAMLCIKSKKPDVFISGCNFEAALRLYEINKN